MIFVSITEHDLRQVRLLSKRVWLEPLDDHTRKTLDVVLSRAGLATEPGTYRWSADDDCWLRILLDIAEV